MSFYFTVKYYNINISNIYIFVFSHLFGYTRSRSNNNTNNTIINKSLNYLKLIIIIIIKLCSLKNKQSKPGFHFLFKLKSHLFIFWHIHHSIFSPNFAAEHNAMN